MNQFIETYKIKFTSKSANFDVFNALVEYIKDIEKNRPDIMPVRKAIREFFYVFMCDDLKEFELKLYQSDESFMLKFKATYLKETDLEIKLKVVKRLESLNEDKLKQMWKHIYSKINTPFSTKASFKNALFLSACHVLRFADIDFYIQDHEEVRILMGELKPKSAKL